MKKKPLLYSLILMSGIYSCSVFNSGDGYLRLGVAFPQKSFTLKFIPEDTANIRVEVSGEGLSSALSLSLTRNEPSRTVKVPGGKKQVKATAFNQAGKVLATGSNSVDVIVDTNNRVEVTLEPVSVPEPLQSLSPAPVTDSPLPVVSASAAPLESSSPAPILPSAAPIESSSPVPEQTASAAATSSPHATGSGSLIFDSGPALPTDTPSTSPTATSSATSNPAGGANARVNVLPDDITVQPAPTAIPTPAT